MGRFDALTQIDKQLPKPPTPPPVDPPLVENEVVRLLAKKQTNKSASQQTDLPASVQTSKEAKKQTDLPANQQVSKSLKKFGSYLTEESLKGLKRIAFETDRKDYEVLQEAVDQYLERQKTS